MGPRNKSESPFKKIPASRRPPLSSGDATPSCSSPCAEERQAAVARLAQGRAAPPREGQQRHHSGGRGAAYDPLDAESGSPPGRAGVSAGGVALLAALGLASHEIPSAAGADEWGDELRLGRPPAGAECERAGLDASAAEAVERGILAGAFGGGGLLSAGGPAGGRGARPARAASAAAAAEAAAAVDAVLGSKTATAAVVDAVLNGKAALPPAHAALEVDSLDLSRAASAAGDGGRGIVPPGASEPLPPAAAQLTLRALAAGLLVGGCYSLLAARLALRAGVTPSFQVAVAGGCWLLLWGVTWMLGRDGCLSAPASAQEVAVASAAALACAGSVAAASFGATLEALSAAAYEAVGVEAPGNSPGDVLALGFKQRAAWAALVSVSGALLVVPFRSSLLGRGGSLFPTGTAAGQLIAAVHTPGMSFHGRAQAARFAKWGAASLLVSAWEWMFNNPACSGFRAFPTFGFALANWGWLFDFSTPLLGIGLLAPLGVAWSMLAGALLAWAIVLPLLDGWAGGVHYPSSLPAGDPRGLFGYQLALGLSLCAAEGIAAAAAYLAPSACRGERGGARRRRRRSHAAALADGGGASGGGRRGSRSGGGRRRSSRSGGGGGGGRRGRPGILVRWRERAARAVEADAMAEAQLLQFSLTSYERALRRQVFASDAMPRLTAAALFASAALLAGAAFGLPRVLSPLPGLRWWHTAAAVVAAPVAALAAARGAGGTDVSIAPAIGAAAAALVAAWAGGLGGAGAGLAVGGLLAGIAQSAVQMGYSFAAGYVVMASPSAIFAAHAIGSAAGAVAAPLAYAVAAHAAPLSPVAAPARVAAAAFAARGLGALPPGAWWVALAGLLGGLLLAACRGVASSRRVRGAVPSPAVMGVMALAGANVAVGVAVGAAARAVWAWRSPRGAASYAALVGAALVAGDGAWGAVRGLLGAFGVEAPICMEFTRARA
ncbi:metal-nicotianamine transporter-like [Raphidocelis subcapitata]|uniref:Metal-nicotianamine transporter-like n=1 Tax=Raphidocelis subcapitata TaxID=307507 RepID=A0A2V0PKR9_9CHLO|nr:metal-nicotianamine transporter-like [Raphidocelis subcapitata]|eukprot:GBF98470.1 metal-nicotianamine transporter-like [Raphidocelis subcapitata]